MTQFLSIIKTTARSAIIAAVIGAAGFAAAPASAAESFSLHFGTGPGGQPSFGFGINSGPQQGGGNWNGRPGRGGYNGGGFNACYSDNQLVAGLRAQGFERIYVTDSGRRSAEVRANKGRYVYVLDVNKCTGSVDVVSRNRIGNGFPQPRPGFGFGMHFGS